jgi:hypothetical protein
MHGLHTASRALKLAALLLGMAAAQPALAQTLGNDAPGFADGSFPDLVPDVLAATAGSPSPFDGGIGADPFENFSASWSFSYAAVAQPIGAASLTLGILDHDSASPGSQIASFAVGGIDLTALLNAAFESRGGASGEYNVYTIALPNSAFPALAGGSPTFSLALQGPVLTPPLFGGDPVQEDFNGATLIFSSLSITPVPEPSAAALLAAGILAVAGLARARGRPA